MENFADYTYDGADFTDYRYDDDNFSDYRYDDQNFTDFRYDADNFTDYDCLENLLYILNNCPTASVEWSLGGRCLKIKYRQFAREYLKGPLQCENAFSFINNMERCGFKYICIPYPRISGSHDVDKDELVFTRMEDYDYRYDYWKHFDADYKDMYNNNLYTKAYFNKYPFCYNNGGTKKFGSPYAFCHDHSANRTVGRPPKSNRGPRRNPSWKKRSKRIPQKFRDYYLEKPTKRCRSPRNVPSPQQCKSTANEEKPPSETSRNPSKSGFEDFDIFKNLQFHPNIMFFKEDAKDDVFLKDTSKDVMWCGSFEPEGHFGNDAQQLADDAPSFCICPSTTTV